MGGDKTGIVYQQMEDYRSKSFNQKQRQRQVNQLLLQIYVLCQSHQLDPHKLKNLKIHILDYQHALFTGLRAR